MRTKNCRFEKLNIDAMVLSMPSIGWCMMCVKYGCNGMMPVWMAIGECLLCGVIGFMTWQEVIEPGLYEQLNSMPLSALIMKLVEREDLLEPAMKWLEEMEREAEDGE